MSSLERQARGLERYARERNQRISDVLRTVLGTPLSDQPQDWWTAWSDYNELSRPSEKPTYQQDYLAGRRTHLRATQPLLVFSCRHTRVDTGRSRGDRNRLAGGPGPRARSEYG